MAALYITTFLAGCGSPTSDASAQATVAPQVGQTWYVMDHAYTDTIYQMIQQSGTAAWPAQTTNDNPDESYHLAHPYPCKVTDAHGDGFYKCDVDSDHTLDVTTVLDESAHDGEGSGCAGS